MAKFKRVSLVGSEEVFQPSRPAVVEDTDDQVTEVIDMRRRDPTQRSVPLTAEELELLVEAIQASKYPSKARPPSLDKHERLDMLRAKLQSELR